MKKCVMGVIIAVSAGGLRGMDVAEFWEKAGIIDSAAVTSKDMTLTLNSHRSMSQWGIWMPEEQRGVDVVPGEKIVLRPGQEIVFQGRHVRVTFRPVAFKTRHQGFRLQRDIFGFSSMAKPAEIAYAAFSDTPLAVGEEDVEMVMDDEGWVQAEDSRSLEIAKLGWNAEYLVKEAETIMQDPEMMASVLKHGDSANIWNTLAERGLIDTNAVLRAIAGKGKAQAPPEEPPPAARKAEPQPDTAGDAQPEAEPQARTLWPYALIPPAFLAALYFMRKKRK